jgi:hypothetical protein
MTWPTVTEMPRRLDAVSRDTFIDRADDVAHGATYTFRTEQES